MFIQSVSCIMCIGYNNNKVVASWSQGCHMGTTISLQLCYNLVNIITDNVIHDTDFSCYDVAYLA